MDHRAAISALPAACRDESFRNNCAGWDHQVGAITRYVAETIERA